MGQQDAEDPKVGYFSSTNNTLTSTAINKILKTAARSAEIKHRRVYPYILRHSKLTHLAKHLTSQEMMIYAGHKKLATTQKYVHLSGADLDDKILQINGIKPAEDKPEPLKPKKCPRCHCSNDASFKYCGSCGMVLTNREAFDLKDLTVNDDFKEFMKDMFMKWKNNIIL